MAEDKKYKAENLSEDDKKLIEFYTASIDGVVKFFEEALPRLKSEGVKAQFNNHLGFVRLIKERLPELINKPYELQAAYDALQERLRGLANDNHDLDEKIKEFDAYRQQRDSEFEDLNSKIQKYEADIADLNKQLADAKKDKPDKRSSARVKELEAQIEEKDKLYQAVVKERDGLTNATVLATQEIEASKERITSLEEQVTKYEKQVVDLGDKVNSLNREKSEREQKISQYEAKISEYEGRIQELTDNLLGDAQKTDQAKLIQSLKGQITKWKGKRDSAVEERDKAQADHSTLSKDLSKVKAQLHEVQRVYAAATEEKDKLDGVLGKIQKSYKKLEDKLAATITDLAQERSKSRRFSRITTGLESVVAQLTRTSQRDTNELRQLLVKYFNYNPNDFSRYKGEELTTYIIGRLGLEIASALLKSQKSAEKKLQKKEQAEKPVAKKKSDKKDKKSKKHKKK